MTLYFTSDTHYGHANIIKYSKRPYRNVEEMDQDLIDRHNAIVPKDGVVYHLGDFAFANEHRQVAIMAQLNGTYIFLRGNHDKADFTRAISAAKQYHGRQIILMEQCHEIKHNGQMLVLCHYGMKVWNKSHRGSWNLYGHSHGSLPPVGLQVDVGVDAPFITGKAEYRPYTFEEIAAFMSKRQVAVHDHHGEMK